MEPEFQFPAEYLHNLRHVRDIKKSWYKQITQIKNKNYLYQEKHIPKEYQIRKSNQTNDHQANKALSLLGSSQFLQLKTRSKMSFLRKKSLC